MEHKPIYPEIRPESVVIPKGQDAVLLAQLAHRPPRDAALDWDALKFQADYDPKYRRAQMRYIGTGGTGVDTDDNAVPAEHFTFSTMVLPAGCEGPLHLHTDAEEVFFVLRGNKLRFIIEHQGERFETVLKERDLFSVPPGVYRGLVNEGIEEALMCVIIGNSQAGDADLSAGPSGRQDQAPEGAARLVGWATALQTARRPRSASADADIRPATGVMQTRSPLRSSRTRQAFARLTECPMTTIDKDRVEERLTSGILGQWYVVGEVRAGEARASRTPSRRSGATSCSGATPAARCIAWKTIARIAARGSRAARSTGQHLLPLPRRHPRRQRHHRAGAGDAGLRARRPQGGRQLCGDRGNDGIFVYFPSKERPQPPRSSCRRNSPIRPGAASSAWAAGTAATASSTTISPTRCTPATCTPTCFTLAFGAKQDVMQVEKRDDGFYIARVEQKDVNLDWTHVVIDGTQVYCRLDIPYPAAAGPAGRSASSAIRRRSMRGPA